MDTNTAGSASIDGSCTCNPLSGFVPVGNCSASGPPGYVTRCDCGVGLGSAVAVRPGVDVRLADVGEARGVRPVGVPVSTVRPGEL